MNRVVVVGNGMAGARFVRELVERDPGRRFAITVVGDEPGAAYNRVLLSNVLAGVTRADAIELVAESWYAEHGITLHTGAAVTAINRDTEYVQLADGTLLEYDTLVLATGSTAVLPPIPGLRGTDGALLDGVTLFRTRADCAAIDARVAAARRVVVVGAGVLGLEAARGLAGRGRQVMVVQREDRLMERQLDSTAARLLGHAYDALGVTIRAGVTVAQVHGDAWVSAVTLSDDSRHEADLVVLCCGVQPRVDLAATAGLKINRGVVVDDQLRSLTDPDIYAIGECAEHDGRVYGLVAPVWEQARVAARALAGDAVAYAGSTQLTRLKAAGVELAAMGESSALDEHELPDEAELVTFADRSRGVYQKLVVRDERLVAAILLGDTRNAGTITQLFERGAAVPQDRAALLMVRRNSPVTAAPSPTALPASATICQCNGVTKAAITAAWQDGAREVAEIAARTRATTGCGTCCDTVCGLLDWLTAAG